MAGHFVGVVGVIYAVLVAFVVVTAWQARARAEDLMIQEQHSVDYLFHLDDAYPSEQATIIRYLLRDYAVNTYAEWNQMERGLPLCTDISESDIDCFQSSGAISKRANLLAHCVEELSVNLSSLKTWQRLRSNEVIYQQGMMAVQVILESRAERRLRYGERTLQSILWTAFFFGALLLAAMTYFVSGQRRFDQLVRTCALFGMVGMMSAIALVFDRPYSGKTHVDGSGWATMVAHFDRDLKEEGARYPGLPDRCRKETADDSPL
jgi:hypothetical protein